LQTREWRRGFDHDGPLLAERDELRAELLRLQKAGKDHASGYSPVEASLLGAQLDTPLDASFDAPADAQFDPPAAEPIDRRAPPPPDRADAAPSQSAPERRRTNINRIFVVGAALCVLAVVGWFLMQSVPTPVKEPPTVGVTAPTPGTVIRDCPRCPAMTVLATGRFQQGSDRADAAAFEKPQRWVAIGLPIAMSTTAVTVEEFSAFIAASGRPMQGCDTYDGEWKSRPDNSWENPGFVQSATHPVTCVSWSDAKAYAAWLSATTGHRYRLPSASEWEYAARAGGESVLPWKTDGSDACASANVADESAARRFPGWTVFACNDGYVYTAPVASFRASAFGLHDMLGNVFQWTEDCWNADYTGAPADGSARMYGECSEHELRGGSWFSTPAFVRADYRNHFAANYRTSSVGIRLVRDLTP
jgi:formylglycine-generating enzyme required for sulfatase activity